MSQNIAAVSVRLIYCEECICMAVHEVFICPLFVYTQTVALEVFDNNLRIYIGPHRTTIRIKIRSRTRSRLRCFISIAPVNVISSRIAIRDLIVTFFHHIVRSDHKAFYFYRVPGGDLGNRAIHRSLESCALFLCNSQIRKNSLPERTEVFVRRAPIAIVSVLILDVIVIHICFMTALILRRDHFVILTGKIQAEVEAYIGR